MNYAHLLSWTLLKIEGKDSTQLLNRLLTISVQGISLGEGSWTFLLSSKGQVEQAFWLLRCNDNQYWALTQTGAEELRLALDYFIFGEQVQLTVEQAYSCFYLSTTEPEGLTLLSSCLALTNQLTQVFNSDILSVGQEAFLIQEKKQENSIKHKLAQKNWFALSSEEFEQLRIYHGGALPRSEYQDVTPLDVSLKGITEGKGCYPGQEVIERTLALGKPAKLTTMIKVMSSIEELEKLEQSHQKGEPLSLYLSESTKLVGKISSLCLCSPQLQQTLGIKESAILFGIAQLKRRALNEELILYVGDQVYPNFKFELILSTDGLPV